jgi:DNA polymerase III epsilon subunit-like protein
VRRPAPPPLTGTADRLAATHSTFGSFHEALNRVGYVVLDYETTGLDVGNRPVQVAALRCVDGVEVDWLNLYMDPGEPLGEWSRANLRDSAGAPLTDGWLAGQASILEQHERLTDFIGDSVVVAQYLPFDAEVLERSLLECGLRWQMAGGLDTKGFFAAALPYGTHGPAGYRLAQLTEFFGVDLGDNHHDAMYDVVATHEVLQRGLVHCGVHGDAAVLDGRVQRAKFIRELRTYFWGLRPNATGGADPLGADPSVVAAV